MKNSKRASVLIGLVVLICAAAICFFVLSATKGGALKLKKPAEANQGISNLPLGMYLTATDYQDGILTCVLSNQSGYEMTYGAEYYLEKEENGQWVSVEPQTAYGWDRMIYQIADLEEVTLTYDLTVFGELTKGKYRLVKNDMEAEFTLVPDLF